jgi:hypothetical protein
LRTVLLVIYFMYALVYRRKNVGYSLSVSVEGVVMLLLFLAPLRRNLIPQMSVSGSQAVNMIKKYLFYILYYYDKYAGKQLLLL